MKIFGSGTLFEGTGHEFLKFHPNFERNPTPGFDTPADFHLS